MQIKGKKDFKQSMEDGQTSILNIIKSSYKSKHTRNRNVNVSQHNLFLNVLTLLATGTLLQQRMQSLPRKSNSTTHFCPSSVSCKVMCSTRSEQQPTVSAVSPSSFSLPALRASCRVQHKHTSASHRHDTGSPEHLRVTSQLLVNMFGHDSALVLQYGVVECNKK